MLAHTSPRFRTQQMDLIYALTGGVERAVAWADESSENYGKFLALWARGQMRTNNVELNAGSSIEDMLRAIDSGDHARVVSPDGLDPLGVVIDMEPSND